MVQPFAPGAVLEGTPYRLVALIGSGANGAVYRGEHLNLRKPVVIKVSARTTQEAPELADRMRLEAQALARLQHPNLVEVIDSGIASGRPFFVMEDDGGIPLEDELSRRRSLPAAEAIAVACDVLEGLAFIHESGLVHRDIQPHNLLLCVREDGSRVVRIVDFGLIKVLGGHDQHQLSPLAFPTAEGTSLGTPRYLSPEQARGGPIDPRSDLYGMGCVLFRMLTGRDPFAHHTELAKLLVAHLSETPTPPSQLVAIGPALDRTVLCALAKRPDDRFPSARAFQHALREALASDARASSPSEVDPRWARTMAIAEPEPMNLGGTVAMVPDRAPVLVPAPPPPTVAQPQNQFVPVGPAPINAPIAGAAHTVGNLTAAPLPSPAVQFPQATPPAPAPAQPAGSPRRARPLLVLFGSSFGFMLLTVLTLLALRSCGVRPVPMGSTNAIGAR